MPSRIFEVNDLSIGVIGLTTYGLARLTTGGTASRITVLRPEEAAAEAVDALEGTVDIIVALTHLGIEGDRRLAAAVPGIDLIVGGHSHTAIEPPEQVGQTWIVQAGSYGRQLGVLRMQVAEQQIVALDGELRDLVPDALPASPSAEVVALTEHWRDVVEQRFGRRVGSAPEDLRRGEGESALGRLAAEMIRVSATADVGIANSGGLRADILAGELVVGDLYEVFPFSNEIVTFEVSGQTLVTMLLRSVSQTLRDRSPLQLSGVQYTWRMRLNAPEMLSAKVGGKPLTLDATYTIATNSYVAEQWRSNLGHEPAAVSRTGVTVLEAAITTAESGPLLAPVQPSAVQQDP